MAGKSWKEFVEKILTIVLIATVGTCVMAVKKANAESSHFIFAYSISDDTDTAVSTGLNAGLNYEGRQGQGWGLLAKAGLKIISDYGDQLSRCYLYYLNPGNNSMQCMLGAMTYDEAMSKWETYLQSSVVQDNSDNIIGFALSDDWYYSPGAGKKLFQDMKADINKYVPGHKSICIFSANTSLASSPESYANFAAALNYSSQGCDMVGFYLYPTIKNKPLTYFSNAVKGLEINGLDTSVTPVIGIAQSYNITGAGVEEEVKYMCDNGATDIGFWAYNTGAGGGAANSADIRDGMSRGIKYCESIWGSGSVGPADPYPLEPYPYSDDSALPDIVPPEYVLPDLPADEVPVIPLYPVPADVPGTAKDACIVKENSAGLIPCGRNLNDPATSWNECRECDFCSLVLMIQLIITFFLEMATVVPVLAIVFSGFLYVFAAGKPDLINQSKTIRKHALIGFAVIFLAWVVVDGLLATFGYIDPIEGQWYAICDNSPKNAD